MAATPISLCNLALAKIRVPAITSFEDGTTEADTCKQIYAEMYEQELGEHRWKFAYSGVALTKLTTPGPPGWNQLWQIPVDCLILHTVRAIGPGTPTPTDAWPGYEPDPPKWDRHHDKIVTALPDDYSLWLWYIKRVTEDKLPTYFRKYFVPKLRAVLAGSITGREEYVEAAEKEAEVALRRARLKDSQARTPPSRTPSRFVTYR